MELRWLEVFVAVAEELHFGRAAERVRMAQSPLSQVVRKLERELGTALFERSTRSVSLTAAGQALLPHARAALAELDLGRRATQAAANEAYGRVRVGFSGLLNHQTLPPLASAVRARHPAIDLELVGRSSSAESIQALRNGSLDLAFVGLPNDHADLAIRVIGTERLGAVLPRSHPLAALEELRLADLKDAPFVALPEPSVLREQLLSACVAADFRPRIVSSVPDAYVMLLLVAAGVGVTLMPESVSTIVPASSVLRPLTDDPAPTITTGLAWRRGDRSVALRAVVTVAAETLRTSAMPGSQD